MRSQSGDSRSAIGWPRRTLCVQRLGQVDYDSGLVLQEELVHRRRAGEVDDQLLLLEHPHVLTMGSRTDLENILTDPQRLSELGIEIHKTGRGGDVTYHGPGQLVGYPIIDLKPDRQDLHAYLRSLESALIGALVELDLVGELIPGLTGVWVGGLKVAAVGIRVSSGWITSHGFALNVATDLSFFDAIVPCGIQDKGVTSLERLLGAPVAQEVVEGAVITSFAREFGYGAVEGPGGKS